MLRTAVRAPRRRPSVRATADADRLIAQEWRCNGRPGGGGSYLAPAALEWYRKPNVGTSDGSFKIELQQPSAVFVGGGGSVELNNTLFRTLNGELAGGLTVGSKGRARVQHSQFDYCRGSVVGAVYVHTQGAFECKTCHFANNKGTATGQWGFKGLAQAVCYGSNDKKESNPPQSEHTKCTKSIVNGKTVDFKAP